MLVPLVVSTRARSFRGDVGVDAIALVAIVWALALGEFLAAAIVALMMSGGAALEAWAAGRARRELRLLVARAPRSRTATRRQRRGGRCRRARSRATSSSCGRARSCRPTARWRAGGDHRRVRSDGRVAPRRRSPAGDPVRSGTANAGDTFDLRVTSPAAESAYAGDRPARPGRRERPRAVHPARRPLRRVLPSLLARRRRPRVARVRRLRSGAGGDGRRHSLPTHPGRSDRVRGGPLPGCTCRHHRQGSRRARAPRRGAHRPPGQDRHPHARLPGGRAGRR